MPIGQACSRRGGEIEFGPQTWDVEVRVEGTYCEEEHGFVTPTG